MRLTTRQDIDLPPDVVFDALSDLPKWEREARRQGIGLVRTDALGPAGGPGMCWDATFDWRERRRHASVSLDTLERPTLMTFSGEGDSLAVSLRIDVQALASGRSRLTVTVEVKPRSVLARVFVQTLRLGRARLETRFRDRIATIAADLERDARGRA
jgi:carbon monoxide dehydrogenase subunit G